MGSLKMLEFIYFMQSKLIADGASIDNVMALFCAVIAITFTTYLLWDKK